MSPEDVRRRHLQAEMARDWAQVVHHLAQADSVQSEARARPNRRWWRYHRTMPTRHSNHCCPRRPQPRTMFTSKPLPVALSSFSDSGSTHWSWIRRCRHYPWHDTARSPLCSVVGGRLQMHARLVNKAVYPSSGGEHCPAASTVLRRALSSATTTIGLPACRVCAD